MSYMPVSTQPFTVQDKLHYPPLVFDNFPIQARPVNHATPTSLALLKDLKVRS